MEVSGCGKIDVWNSDNHRDNTYNYCKCANECYLAPLCLGEHCPLLRIKGELCEGNCSCPELKVYLDIFMKCIHRFHPFEPISVLQLLKSN